MEIGLEGFSPSPQDPLKFGIVQKASKSTLMESRRILFCLYLGGGEVCMSHKEIGGSIVLHCGQPAPSQTENLLNFLLGQGGKHTCINHDQPTSFEL